MNPEDLLAAVKELAEALRTDMAAQMDAISKRCDAIAEDVKKRDAAGERDNGIDREMEAGQAERVAADSVSRAEFRQMQERVNGITVKQLDRAPADRDALAELQSRADVSYASLGEGRCPAPMQGESVIDFACRVHRPLQKHSKRFAKSELAVIARDPATFTTVLDGIRSDAYEAGLNPVGLPEFQHRAIKSESPGGHRITSWVGSGTIFKQMSRPVKYVTGIGGDGRYASGAGAIHVKH
jgi:hypothetical protein